MFRASSLPIIRSFLLYIRHWYVSCRFLMTVSNQNQDGASSILIQIGNGHYKLHETYQCRMYSRKLLMMGREVGRNL